MSLSTLVQLGRNEVQFLSVSSALQLHLIVSYKQICQITTFQVPLSSQYLPVLRVRESHAWNFLDIRFIIFY